MAAAICKSESVKGEVIVNYPRLSAGLREMALSDSDYCFAVGPGMERGVLFPCCLSMPYFHALAKPNDATSASPINNDPISI